MAPGQQWLFRHSSPVQKDIVTRVVISDPHGYNSVGSAADAAVPLILRPFVPAANQYVRLILNSFLRTQLHYRGLQLPRPSSEAAQTPSDPTPDVSRYFLFVRTAILNYISLCIAVIWIAVIHQRDLAVEVVLPHQLGWK